MSPIPEEVTTDELDLAQLWRELTWSKAALFTCVLAGISAGLLIGIFSTPTYRAEVLIAPIALEPSASAIGSALDRFSGLASLAGITLGGQSDERAINLATLSSRAFTLEFIDEYALLPVLFDDRWDARQARWRVDGDEVPTRLDAWEKFDRSIRKFSELDGGLYSLSIEWRDAGQAMAWANALVERANERLRSRAIKEAQESIDFLNAEAEKTTIVGLQQAIYRLIEVQINKIMLANARKEFAFKIVDPAVRPDNDKYVWPNFVVLGGLGLVAGVFFGSVLSFLLARRATRTTAR